VVAAGFAWVRTVAWDKAVAVVAVVAPTVEPWLAELPFA